MIFFLSFRSFILFAHSNLIIFSSNLALSFSHSSFSSSFLLLLFSFLHPFSPSFPLFPLSAPSSVLPFSLSIYLSNPNLHISSSLIRYLSIPFSSPFLLLLSLLPVFQPLISSVCFLSLFLCFVILSPNLSVEPQFTVSPLYILIYLLYLSLLSPP